MTNATPSTDAVALVDGPSSSIRSGWPPSSGTRATPADPTTQMSPARIRSDTSPTSSGALPLTCPRAGSTVIRLPLARSTTPTSEFVSTTSTGVLGSVTSIRFVATPVAGSMSTSSPVLSTGSPIPVVRASTRVTTESSIPRPTATTAATATPAAPLVMVRRHLAEGMNLRHITDQGTGSAPLRPVATCRSYATHGGQTSDLRQVGTKRQQPISGP